MDDKEAPARVYAFTFQHFSRRFFECTPAAPRRDGSAQISPLDHMSAGPPFQHTLANLCRKWLRLRLTSIHQNGRQRYHQVNRDPLSQGSGCSHILCRYIHIITSFIWSYPNKGTDHFSRRFPHDCCSHTIKGALHS